MEKVETVQRISILQVSIHKFKFEFTCIVRSSDDGILHFRLHVSGLPPPSRSKKRTQIFRNQNCFHPQIEGWGATL
jgi:hypothetical protein